ncbi:MAG: FAD-dependent monooxygenase [Caulobacterales bacterium]|nr:FAD-dependent monooxygenase [Caulobacterales bacterium]
MLARRGEAVVVFERFAEPAPVGSGFLLQPTGLAVLAATGLEGQVRDRGAPIRRLYGERADTGRSVLDVAYTELKGRETALGLHRASLFACLYGACLDAGVVFETGFDVVGIDADGRRFEARDGRRSAAFDLLVDALGTRSPLGSRRRDLDFGALWATVPLGHGFLGDALEQRYQAARRMVGVLPIGAAPGVDGPAATFFWSLKPRDLDAWRAQGLQAWKAQVRGLWPETEAILDGLTDPDQLILARYAHRTRAGVEGARLAVIGDAAHSTSPQLGQGVNMGLLDAWALDRALAAHADLDAALGVYAGARWLHVRLYQALSWVFTPFYQSDDPLRPALRDHVLGWVSRVPPSPRLLAAAVSGLLLDPRRSLGL